MLTADEIRKLLNLQPHPIEGGYFVETYRSPIKIARETLGGTYSSERLLSTAIFYLLTPDTFSAVHRLPGDELFHFYLGDPVEMLMLKPDGSSERVILGQDIAGGARLQHNVPAGWWQGSRLIASGAYALVGTTMSPGFEYADYVTGDRAKLISQYPNDAEAIRLLTRP